MVCFRLHPRLALAAMVCFAALHPAAIVSCLGTQTDNHGLHAVPVPPGKTPVMDGDLGEWDFSGEILACYDLETLQDTHSVRVSAMYDDEALFLALKWKDAVPMGNSHDPRYQANRGWAGDAVQLRFKTDKITHLTAWYCKATGEPAAFLELGKSLTDASGVETSTLVSVEGWKMKQGMEMAFRVDEDGKGYVQEIKIPWPLITAGKKYGPGEEFRLGFDFLWGEADWPVHRYSDNLTEGATSREFFWTAHQNWGPIYLEKTGNLTLPEPAFLAAFRAGQQPVESAGPVEIRYELPVDSRVSLVIEDAQGKRLRNLVAAGFRKKGQNIERWDGRDEDGKAVPPGRYRYRAIRHEGVKLSYALSFANPGNPTWEVSDGGGAFYGDHTAPQAVAADGEHVALACPMGEAGKHLIGLDLDGRKRWGLPNRTAFEGGQIALAAEGKTLWVANEGKKSTIYRVDIATGKYAPWEATQKDREGNEFRILDLGVSDLPGVKAAPQEGPNLTAIAIRNNRLAVALKRENKIKILDGSTAQVLSEMPIALPQSLAFTPTGELLVLSQGRIIKVLEDGTFSKLGEKEIPNAHSLAVDPAGFVYVSTRGEDQNVKVFSAEGKSLREIGSRGGRPTHGRFIKEGMRDPAGLAIDSRGRLWVSEETMNPKRVSVWNAQTGEFLTDFVGTTTYAGAGALNPFDKSMAFSDDTVYALDWESGRFDPVYSIAGSEKADDLFPPSVHNLTSKVVRHDGRIYIYTSGLARRSPEVHCTMWDGKEWRSVAHLGKVIQTQDKTGEYAKYHLPIFAGKANQAYAWTDENGDGLVQPAEIVFGQPEVDGSPAELRSYVWGQLPDSEGTVTYLLKGRNELVQFPVMKYNRVGAPVYDVLHPRILRPDRKVSGENGQGMVMGGGEGRIYINQDPLVALDKDGKVAGTYPNKHVSVHGSHSAKAARPGYLIGPSSILGTAQIGKAEQGEAGEVFCLNGNLGENYLFTQDAIFVQSLFRDTRGNFLTPAKATKGMPMDETTAGGESFGGNFLKTSDGKVYVTNGGTDVKVLEVSGLDTIRRFGGEFEYTASQFAEAERLSAQKSEGPSKASLARIPQGPAFDGKSNASPAAEIVIEEGPSHHYGKVLVRYDKNAMYLSYRVRSQRAGIKNAGQDEKLLFKTGDAVDLMLGMVDNRENDARILLSLKDGRPVAVINRKTARGAPPEERYEFSSPSRSIAFDSVRVAPEVRLITSPVGDGYVVTAEIPWPLLGIDPSPGKTLKADLGILFGNREGTQTISRKYWSNKETGLVNDVPGEADLTPEKWGTIILE